MPLNRPLALTVGLAAGVVAAVGFYTAAAGAAPSPAGKPWAKVAPAVELGTPRPTVSFAPCVRPAALVDGACVTHTIVTKAADAAAPQPAAASVRGSNAGFQSVGSATSGATSPSPSAGDDGATENSDDAAHPEDSEESDDSSQAEHDDQATPDTEQQDHGEPSDEPSDEPDHD